MSELNLHTRWARDDDTPALLELFARSFGEAMSPEQWAWKYRLAKSPGTVCLDGERIVAFNGGMPRHCHDGAARFNAVQMGDVMVDPAYRGILNRRGPFYHAVQAFFGEAVGSEAHHAYRYAFGFPHARHARLGRALALYCQPDAIRQASWPAAPRRAWRDTARPLTDADAATTDALWGAMCEGLPHAVIGERSAAWLEHRYATAPHCYYARWLITARLTRRPVGICVLRHHGEHAELLDLIAPPGAMARVISVARHITARLGAGQLTAWLTPTVASALAPSRPTLEDTDVVVPGSCVNGSEQGMEPAGRWWLMGGDTDFR
ncbi:GNAT family N-acetyltransferase [Vreelandella jeotgali]|uniref:GNAT family N-acetyltransferase n=1 Tax=Vreelandella jeotgali TaxID=553386 RepID=UPI00034A2C5F|nr:GNAT family N-acetyltransferase [Halomonas jeotgali]